MIKSWKEIMLHYDAIKDHKPRATKKLKELGEILASAYKKSPAKADEMWQYIIDLNVSDNVEFARFYVVQVFTKLVCELTPFTAMEFLVMNPERLRLLLLYGFEGRNFENCVYYALGYYIILEDYDGAKRVINLISERQNSDNKARGSIEGMVSSSVFGLQFGQKPWDRRQHSPSDLQRYCYVKKTSVVKFCDLYSSEFRGSKLAIILEAYKAVIMCEPVTDVQLAKYYAEKLIEYKETLFLDYLFVEKEVLQCEVLDYIDLYNQISNQPLPVHMEDHFDRFEQEKTTWYRSVVLRSDKLLKSLFSNHGGYFCDFMEEYLNQQIKTGEWDNFSFCIAQLLNSAEGYHYDYCMNFIENCFRYYVVGDDDDEPTASYRCIGCVSISITAYFGLKQVQPVYKSRFTEEETTRFIEAISVIEQQMVDDERKMDIAKIKEKFVSELSVKQIKYRDNRRRV